MRPDIGQKLVRVEVRPKLSQDLLKTGRRLWNLVKVCVGKNGRVSSVTLVKPSHETFDRAMLDALTQWQFDPLRVDGRVHRFCYMQKNVLRVEKDTPAQGDSSRPDVYYPPPPAPEAPCDIRVRFRQAISSSELRLLDIRSEVRREASGCKVEFVVAHRLDVPGGKPLLLQTHEVLAPPAPERAVLEISADEQTGPPRVAYGWRWRESAEAEREGDELEEGRARALLATQVPPTIPHEVKIPGTQLHTVMQICVDADGTPKSVSQLQGTNRRFDIAVIDAVWRWRWHPLVENGHARPFCYQARFNLRIN